MPQGDLQMPTRFGKALDYSSVYSSYAASTDAPRYISNKAIDFAGLNQRISPATVYKWVSYLRMYGYQADCPNPYIPYIQRQDIKDPDSEAIREFDAKIRGGIFAKRDALLKDAETLSEILGNAYTKESLADAFTDAETTALSILSLLHDKDKEKVENAVRDFFNI